VVVRPILQAAIEHPEAVTAGGFLVVHRYIAVHEWFVLAACRPKMFNARTMKVVLDLLEASQYFKGGVPTAEFYAIQNFDKDGSADAGTLSTRDFKNADKHHFQSTSFDDRSLYVHGVVIVVLRPRCLVNFDHRVSYRDSLDVQVSSLREGPDQLIYLSSTTGNPHNNPAKWLAEGTKIILKGNTISTSHARARLHLSLGLPSPLSDCSCPPLFLSRPGADSSYVRDGRHG